MGNNSVIRTYTGKMFNPLDPDIDLIDINDIAHALSNTCRYSGHSSDFYSVGQHSVLVSKYCDSHPAASLLHDASEAYICDIPTPVKQSSAFSEYRIIENHLQKLIYTKFNLPEREPKEVKEVDKRMLATEFYQFFPKAYEENVRINSNPYPITIFPVCPHEAKKMFLARFEALGIKSI